MKPKKRGEDPLPAICAALTKEQEQMIQAGRYKLTVNREDGLIMVMDNVRFRAAKERTPRRAIEALPDVVA